MRGEGPVTLGGGANLVLCLEALVSLIVHLVHMVPEAVHSNGLHSVNHCRGEEKERERERGRREEGGGRREEGGGRRERGRREEGGEGILWKPHTLICSVPSLSVWDTGVGESRSTSLLASSSFLVISSGSGEALRRVTIWVPADVDSYRLRFLRGNSSPLLLDLQAASGGISASATWTPTLQLKAEHPLN